MIEFYLGNIFVMLNSHFFWFYIGWQDKKGERWHWTINKKKAKK